MKNYGPDPFVSVILSCHEGDAKYIPRAFASLEAQDLSHDQFEVIIAFDGEPGPIAEAEFSKLNPTFATRVIESGKKTGYYCVSRNQATPFAEGLYISNLDCDNEYEANHLSGLLSAIRTPDPEKGWPHFVYSRINYVNDRKIEVPGEVKQKLPEGPSRLIPWTQQTVSRLLASPTNNFIDTSCFLIGKATLYEVAEQSGCIWDSNLRRFGDWDLVRRFALCGLRGTPVDQASLVYHWTGENLQTTRPLSQITAIPSDIYDSMKAKGLIKD